jgi:hypothetical protein
MLHAMPIAQVFDYLGTRVDGPRAGAANIVINWRFADTNESIASTLQHGALTSITDKTAPNAVTAVATTRSVFERIILGQRTLADAMEHREITTIGDARAVSDLWALLAHFETGFPVIEPAGLTRCRHCEAIRFSGRRSPALRLSRAPVQQSSEAVQPSLHRRQVLLSARDQPN